MRIKRLRVYASLLGVTLWSVWLIDMSGAGVVDRLGKIKGTDFLQFYVAGTLVRDGRTDLLYDVRAQYARAQAVAGTSHETLFLPVQSPQTALAFATLAVLPYTSALTIWLGVTLLLYGGACWLTWRSCTALRGYAAETAVGCAAFPALYSTVLHGQISCVAVLCIAVAAVAFRRDRRLSAGLALGCLVFKPHWVLAAGAVFVAAREWRVIIGMVAAAAAQVGIAYVLMGASVMAGYFSMLRSLPRFASLLEPRPGNTLKGFFSALVPSDTGALAMYTVAAVVTVWVTATVWRTNARFEVRFSAVLLAIVLISPHAFEYDLILLAPAYLLLANWRVEARDEPGLARVGWASAALFVAPLMTLLPSVLRLQFSVSAMVVMLAGLWLIARPRLTPKGASAHGAISVDLAGSVATPR
jgi:alpha-1,2-mannosyltransferase